MNVLNSKTQLTRIQGWWLKKIVLNTTTNVDDKLFVDVEPWGMNNIVLLITGWGRGRQFFEQEILSSIRLCNIYMFVLHGFLWAIYFGIFSFARRLCLVFAQTPPNSFPVKSKMVYLYDIEWHALWKLTFFPFFMFSAPLNAIKAFVDYFFPPVQ